MDYITLIKCWLLDALQCQKLVKSVPPYYTTHPNILTYRSHMLISGYIDKHSGSVCFDAVTLLKTAASNLK